MGERLKGRVAVITGSGRGIGKAIALAMAQEGAYIVTNDVMPGSAEATAREIIELGGKSIAYPCDVTDFEATGRLIKTAADNFGCLDILVNNAGGVKPAPVWEVTEEDFDACMKLNLKGVFNCTRHAAGIMRGQGWGRIISATAGTRLGMPGSSLYGAAKAGIVGFTACVAMELGKFGITCNCYSPIATSEAMTPEIKEAVFGSMVESGMITKEQYDFMSHMEAGPEAIGPLVVYLCTDEASNITGQTFHIMGDQVGIYWEPVLKEGVAKEGGEEWTVDELIKEVPGRLLKDYVNPLKIPGRWFTNVKG